MVLVLATGLIVWGVGQPGPPRLVRLAVSPDEAGLVTPTITVPAVAISPGGEHIAYLAGGEPNVGADQLRARALNSATSTTLVTDGLILNPFFSPNGQSVGFFDRSTAPLTLKRVPVQGGPISTICDLLDVFRKALVLDKRFMVLLRATSCRRINARLFDGSSRTRAPR